MYSKQVVGQFQAISNVDIGLRQWRHNYCSTAVSFPNLELSQDHLNRERRDVKEKNLNCGNSFPRGCSRHHRSRTMARKFWDLFQSWNGKFCHQISQTIPKLHLKFFCATKLTHGQLVVFLLLPWRVSNHFWHC